MFEKAIIIVACAVGGYASVTGTLPAAMIALFGDPTVLGVATAEHSLWSILGESGLDWLGQSGLGGLGYGIGVLP